MKNIIILSLSLFLVACKPDIQPVSAPVITATGVESFSGLTPENKKSCASLVFAGYPVKYPTSDDNFYICRDAYALNFDPNAKTAQWVVQKLEADNYKKEQIPLVNEARPDPFVSQKGKNNLDDFVGVGYEMAFFAQNQDYTYDAIDLSHSYYLTNAFPLYPTQVKVWEGIGAYTRSLLNRYNEIYVISGSIYANGSGRGWVGVPDNPNATGDRANEGKILVPTHIYRVIMEPENKKAIAFLIPNQELPNYTLEEYMVPVSMIERLANIKFFPGISQEEQNMLNQKEDKNFWLSR